MTATGQRGQIPTGDGAARVVVAGAGFGGLAAGGGGGAAPPDTPRG
jgi:hypothetical protein